jgi:hypothetical protein
MNTRVKLLLTFGFVVTLVFVTCCAPASGTSAPSQPTTNAVEPTTAPAVETPPILRISIAQAPLPINLVDLQKNLWNELEKDSTNTMIKSGTPVQFEQSMPRTMAGLIGCQTLMMPPTGEFDLYLMDSSLTRQAEKTQTFQPVPGEIYAATSGAEIGIAQAYQDASGQVFGIPVATIPMMLIYNPEMLGVLPQPVTIEMIVGLSDKYPIWVPEHGGIGIALTHSLVGEGFKPEIFLDPAFYKQLGEYDQLYERYRSMGAGKSASTEEILKAFTNQEIAWTVHSSGFLSLLAQAGYEGAVAVAPFPVVKQQGGSAIAWAWVVPAESKQPELAWQAAYQMTQNPALQRWFLLNGALPVRPAEFERLMVDPGLKGLLPSYMLKNQIESLKQLEVIAAQSPAWQVPANVSLDFYNQRILVEGDKIAAQIVNGTYSPSAAGEVFFKLIQEMGK